MSKFGLLMLGVFAVQATAMLLCLTSFRLRLFRGRWLWPIVTLLVIEATAGVSVVVGIYSEKEWHLLSQIMSRLAVEPLQQPPPHNATPPNLSALLGDQAKGMVRPDFASRSGFEGWQTDLRRELVDRVFKISGIETDQKVAVDAGRSEILAGGIARTPLTFRSFDDADIPAFLFTPQNARAAPAIVVISGHVPEGHSGLDQIAHLANSYQHAAALRLAEAGFVTLGFELRGFGRLGLPFGTDHTFIAYNAILAGTFYRSIIMQDVKRAVDILRSRPEVDPSRIGVTGASFGGDAAATYAALDTRIKAVVFQSCCGALGPLPARAGRQRDQPHYCLIIPGAVDVLMNEDIFFLIAPRPALWVRGLADPNYLHPEFGRVISQAWRASEAEGGLEFVTEPGDHQFYTSPAIEFFRTHL